MRFEEHQQRIADGPFDDFGNNGSQMDPSVIHGIVNRSFLEDGHDMMELPAIGLHTFIQNPPGQHGERQGDHNS